MGPSTTEKYIVLQALCKHGEKKWDKVAELVSKECEDSNTKDKCNEKWCEDIFNGLVQEHFGSQFVKQGCEVELNGHANTNNDNSNKKEHPHRQEEEEGEEEKQQDDDVGIIKDAQADNVTYSTPDLSSPQIQKKTPPSESSPQVSKEVENQYKQQTQEITTMQLLKEPEYDDKMEIEPSNNNQSPVMFGKQVDGSRQDPEEKDLEKNKEIPGKDELKQGVTDTSSPAECKKDDTATTAAAAANNIVNVVAESKDDSATSYTNKSIDSHVTEQMDSKDTPSEKDSESQSALSKVATEIAGTAISPENKVTQEDELQNISSDTDENASPKPTTNENLCRDQKEQDAESERDQEHKQTDSQDMETKTIEPDSEKDQPTSEKTKDILLFIKKESPVASGKKPSHDIKSNIQQPPSALKDTHSEKPLETSSANTNKRARGSPAPTKPEKVSDSKKSDGSQSKRISRSEQQLRNWKKNIGMVWQEIAGHRYGSMFLSPIKAADAPNYYEIIKKPMDLKTIKNRIRDEEITTTAEFYLDVMQMFNNALMYNQEDSEVYSMTMEIIPDAQKCIEQLLHTEIIVGASNSVALPSVGAVTADLDSPRVSEISPALRTRGGFSDRPKTPSAANDDTDFEGADTRSERASKRKRRATTAFGATGSTK
ncbi:hypothetical protein H4219_004521 [Mycoemilia scoparia]|uniref:Bromo domain-containing protein n=1 Tax=Mycoemilia scoparia TaxID=417184 RepID=A0A9W8DR11_9FUNG|nr:hypothetical protein H4219_004521 [Mycoemilia scoparia]